MRLAASSGRPPASSATPMDNKPGLYGSENTSMVCPFWLYFNALLIKFCMIKWSAPLSAETGPSMSMRSTICIPFQRAALAKKVASSATISADCMILEPLASPLACGVPSRSHRVRFGPFHPDYFGLCARFRCAPFHLCLSTYCSAGPTSSRRTGKAPVCGGRSRREVFAEQKLISAKPGFLHFFLPTQLLIEHSLLQVNNDVSEEQNKDKNKSIDHRSRFYWYSVNKKGKMDHRHYEFKNIGRPFNKQARYFEHLDGTES